jgi:lipopolysaccharide assembly outer membrane protein LptD (OstA)
VGLRRVVAALFAGIACAQADVARGAEIASSLELTAESLEYERERDLFVANGSVVVQRGERRLTADWVAFSPSTGRGVASGDVIVSDGQNRLHTRFVEFDVEDMQGALFDARFDVPSGHMRLEGAMIAKTGDQTYSFEKGVFTSCRCPDPESEDPWRIRAESADLEVGGYGTARDTTFEILGVPVAWLPWAIYPLKTERQSGLLLPEVGHSSRNGFEVGVPVFFAAGDPVNVVATPRWLSKRGAKGDLELDYVVGERSEGYAFGSYLNDGDVDPNSLETPFGRNRWSTKGSHDWSGPLATRFKANYLFASDNAFPDDFQELRPWRSVRYLPAVASAEGRAGDSGRFGLVAGAEYFNDRQAPNDTDRDDFILQRLPELGVHALPGPTGPLTWLVPTLDVAYARFDQSERPQQVYSDPRLVTSDGRFFDSGVDGIADSREQGRDGLGNQGGTRPDPNADDFDALMRPEGREGDGVFQEGELLAEGGHRVLLTPRIAVPWRIADAVELYPEAGWHQTFYDGDAGGFASQGLLTGRVELRTQLRRRFGASLTHLLEPRIGWAGIQRTKDRDETPLFVPATKLPQVRLRELQLDNVTLDSADRIQSANNLNVGFGNRFFGAPLDDGAARLLGDVTLLAQYDFAQSRWGRIVVDGSALPIESLATRFWAAFDPQGGHLDEGTIAVAWRHEDGHAAEAGYSYLRDLPEFFGAYPQQNDRFDSYRELDHLNQANLGVRIAFLERWAVTWAGAYSFASTFLIGNKGGIEYFSACGCWAGRLELAQDRSSGVAVRLVYRLVGIGNDAVNPFSPHGEGPGFGSLDAF